MKAAGLPDSLTVINGPEDGTEFPITQREFLIGRDDTCAVNLRLDTAIRRIHARAFAVADGYRIRSLGREPVYVNGKRASTIRSQIARSGDILRAGHTELVLECSADGLASRSRGISLESDFVWALRRGAVQAGRLLRAALRLPGRLLRGRMLAAMACGIALYWFVPEIRYQVSVFWWHVQEAIYGIFG